jgi:predicted Fe-Mo cluster-binding NifX family protein
MKIAIITDDEKTISQHFGRAIYYAVLTIENGQIVQREMRGKLSHKHVANESHEHTGESDQRHGFDPASQSRHG